LQGQFTNDLSGAIGLVAFGLWLNQKGRVFADSTLLRIGPDEWLALSVSIPPGGLIRRLNDYIIADEVDVADVSAQWRSLTLWGENTDALCAVVAATPPPRGQFGRIDGGFVFGTRQPTPDAIWLTAPAGEFDAVMEKIRGANAREAAPEQYTRERLRHRVPAVPEDLGPADFPQEGGIAGEAVSFTKGCFLGQEVMARLKNRGQVRRRLEVLQGAGAPPTNGTALFQAGKKIGETRSAATDGEGFLCFAMITLAGWDPGRPASRTADGLENVHLVRP